MIVGVNGKGISPLKVETRPEVERVDKYVLRNGNVAVVFFVTENLTSYTIKIETCPPIADQDGNQLPIQIPVVVCELKMVAPQTVVDVDDEPNSSRNLNMEKEIQRAFAKIQTPEFRKKSSDIVRDVMTQMQLEQSVSMAQAKSKFNPKSTRG